MTQVVEGDGQAHLLPGTDEGLVDRVAPHLLPVAVREEVGRVGVFSRVPLEQGKDVGGS